MGCRSPVIGFITGEIWSGRWSLGLRVGGLGEGSRIRLAVGAETAHERSRAEPLCLYAGRPRRGCVPRDALSRPTSCPGRQRSPSPCHGSGGWGGGRGKGAGCHPGGAEVGHEPSARCPRDGKGSPCRGQRTICVQPSFLPLLPPEPCPGPGLLLGAFRTECDGGIKRICLETLSSDPEDCLFDVIRKL